VFTLTLYVPGGTHRCTRPVHVRTHDIQVLIFAAIPSEPEDVSEALKHQAFVWAEKSRKTRLAEIKAALDSEKKSL
jgi:hypothetical protein